MKKTKKNLLAILTGTAVLAAAAVGTVTIVKNIRKKKAGAEAEETGAPAGDERIIWIKQPESAEDGQQPETAAASEPAEASEAPEAEEAPVSETPEEQE